MTDAVSKLAQIRAISFDLDDTFWDCEPVIVKAERAVYQWFAEHAPRIYENYTPMQLHEHRVEFAMRHPEYRSDVTFLRRESLKALLSENGYSRDWVEQAFAVFYQVRSQVQLYDEVIPVLQALKVHYKLAAISNGNADLELIGIAGFFDVIQRASLANTPKPHRMMFDNTAQALSLQTDQILHVGDSPETDVGGGLAAGSMTAWFNQHHHDWPEDLPSPDFEINQLSGLISLLPACG